MRTIFSLKKRLRLIFIVYWLLLAYIIAALVWWFISLDNQNHLLAAVRIGELHPGSPTFNDSVRSIREEENRKFAQFAGEGITFLLLIIACAIYIFRAVRKQFRSAQEQQNFMMAITHELKTPIAVAKLNLETLQKRKLEEDKQQKLIQTTLQEANRLNALCNNILLTSQMDAGGYNSTSESVCLSEIADESVGDFKTRFPERTFHRAIAPDCWLTGDRLQLQMAINNLVDNAIKYSPKETPITVTLKKENRKGVLSVTDEGKGISDEEKKKVFEKYYRVGNQATKGAKGTGLGLYLTKKIAARHKATIFVTDNTPTGCIFTIIFDHLENG